MLTSRNLDGFGLQKRKNNKFSDFFFPLNVTAIAIITSPVIPLLLLAV